MPVQPCDGTDPVAQVAGQCEDIAAARQSLDDESVENVLVLQPRFRIDAKHLESLVEVAPNAHFRRQEQAIHTARDSIPQQHLRVFGTRNGSTFDPGPQAPPHILAIGTDDRLRDALSLCVERLLVRKPS